MKIKENRVINAHNFLLKIKGSNSTIVVPGERHLIDKNVFLTSRILSIKFGLIIFLLVTLFKRRYKLDILRNNYLKSNKSSFKVKFDNLYKSRKISFLYLLKRTLIALKITKILKKYIKSNIADKHLSCEFIWYLSCLYTDSIRFKSSGILLNGEVSAQELAILAFVDKNIKINFLMPLYWRYKNKFYYELNKYGNSFILHHPCDMPDFFDKGYEFKIIKYKPKKIVFKKNKLCIGLFLTTFKNYENKRFKIVIQAILDIFAKYGTNIDLIVKPHPYEYELFKKNKYLKNMNIQIANNNNIFKKIDFCFVPQSTVIFELLLYGVPIIILRQIDIYYLFDSFNDEFFNVDIIPKYENVISCPSYIEIINLYKSKNKFDKIQKYLIGNL